MKALQIETSTQITDSTYFRTGDAEPSLEGGMLTILNGEGTRRSSWGAPGVTSTIILQDSDLVAVHVGFHHKHGGGQFWRYFRSGASGWSRCSWASLSDEERHRVLDAAAAHAPGWARSPGKLRVERQAPYTRREERYKIVRQTADGHFVSLYDPSVTYEIGKARIEKAQPFHNGGHYVYDNPDRLAEAFGKGALVADSLIDPDGYYVLLEVEVSGTCVPYYDDGARAAELREWIRECNAEGSDFARNLAFGYQDELEELIEKEAWTKIVPRRVLWAVSPPRETAA